jgi:hypothetical protein
MDTKQTSIWVEIYLLYSSFVHLSKLNYCWACFFVGWCARYNMTVCLHWTVLIWNC